MRFQVLFLADATQTKCLGEPEYAYTREAAVALARAMAVEALSRGARAFCVLDGDLAAQPVHVEELAAVRLRLAKGSA